MGWRVARVVVVVGVMELGVVLLGELGVIDYRSGSSSVGSSQGSSSLSRKEKGKTDGGQDGLYAGQRRTEDGQTRDEGGRGVRARARCLIYGRQEGGWQETDGRVEGGG